MNEQKNNGRGIFYGVIGVATLVVAIVGATFAYFTATAANNIITGNMAKVELKLAVTKVTELENTIGMIPMSNGMVEAAVSNSSTKGSCVDDNGNAVCQIYKIVLTNDSSAGQFVDGYVALRGGSGTPMDFNNSLYVEKYSPTNYRNVDATDTGVGTTMRWAQIFPVYKATANDTDGDGVCDVNGDDKLTTQTVETNYTEATCEHEGNEIKYYSTAGYQLLGVDTANNDVNVSISGIGNPDDGANLVNIRTNYTTMDTKTLVGDTNSDNICNEDGCKEEYKGVLTSKTITGTPYQVIGTNYVRVSNHNWVDDLSAAESYKRQNDVTSALVFNNSVAANDSAEYYVVVWLTENGKNQTASAAGADGNPVEGATTPVANSFFMGNVTFISAQGSEVSASFTDYTRVQSVNAVQ